MGKDKLIYKIFSYLLILAIFFFLGKGLIDDWQRIRDFQFSFNYWYLILSFVFFLPGLILAAFIWNKILRAVEPTKRISNFRALKIFAYSWFGQYLPGKIWMFVGRIYLGHKEGISKKNLTISVIYEIALSIIAAFLLSLFLLALVFDFEISGLYKLYFLPIIIIIVGLILIHPRFFYPIFNFALEKAKKIKISPNNFLSYKIIIRIILLYFIVNILSGIGFFFLVNSITYLPFCNIIDMIGVFLLASVFGIVAFFAPGGLGVRESILVFFLQLYFPLGVAILISLNARVWSTLGEIIFFSIVYLYSKLRGGIYHF